MRAARSERALDHAVDLVFKAFTLNGQLTPMGGYGGRPAGMISGLLRGDEITASSVLSLGFSWISLNIVEPPIKLYGADAKEIEDPQKLSDALFPFTRTRSMARHIQFAAESLKADGNAWWLLRRDKYGVISEATPVPRRAITIEREGSAIKRIRVTVGARQEEHAYEDFLHLAIGIDPDCPTLGLSPLKASMRHVLTDEEWAFSSQMLAQRGGLSVDVLAPTAGTDLAPAQALNQDSVKKIKERIRDAIRGSDRGTPVVLGQPFTAQSVGTFASGLEKLMTLPAIRVAASIGVSHTTLNLPDAGGNLLSGKEKAASQRVDTENCLVPLWSAIAQGLTEKAGPWLPGLFTTGGGSFQFDLTQVKALQGAIADHADWVLKAYAEGVISQNEARHWLNLGEVEGGEAFAIPRGDASVQRGRMEVLQAINAGLIGAGKE